jgi:hypothetical protein
MHHWAKIAQLLKCGTKGSSVSHKAAVCRIRQQCVTEGSSVSHKAAVCHIRKQTAR